MQAKFLSRGLNPVGAMACRRSLQSLNEHSWSYGMQAQSSVVERTQLELWHAGEVPQSLNEHS